MRLQLLLLAFEQRATGMPVHADDLGDLVGGDLLATSRPPFEACSSSFARRSVSCLLESGCRRTGSSRPPRDRPALGLLELGLLGVDLALEP
jgi:hypothetical protein